MYLTQWLETITHVKKNMKKQDIEHTYNYPSNLLTSLTLNCKMQQ